MTNREKLINYVRFGGEKFLCSPQIGAGAGFDTKMANKTWFGDTTLEDTASAWEKFDIVPLFNCGLPDLTQLVSSQITVESKQSWDEENKRRITSGKFITPKGTLTSMHIEEELKGVVPTKYFISEEDELAILEYYLDSLLEVSDFSAITNGVKDARALIGENNAMDIQWAMQPYELMCFPDTMNTAIFAKIVPDEFARLMDKILKLNEKLLKAVAQGGADFVFLGGPGSEMISPQYYEDYLVPYSKIVSQMAHENGLLIYSHICSPIEPMLTKGYYNEMGIDLFETLSMAPVGNVKSIEDAFSKLSPEICTRGNIGLDVLLSATPEEVKVQCLNILETAKRMGRKHILAASDYMFYQIPYENVKAMADATNEFNQS